MDNQTLVQHLSDLAKEVSSTDYFEMPFGMSKDETYLSVAEEVLTNYLSSSKEHREEVMLATIIHLIVENSVYNYRFMFNGED